MTFVKYIKDQIQYLFTAFILLLGTFFFIWMYPEMELSGDFIFSLILLLLFITVLSLTIGYLRKRDYYQGLEKAKTEVEGELPKDLAVKEEEKLVATVVNDLKKAQQKSLQELIIKQQDQEDFLNHWVHNIKVPIAALGLINESIEEDIPEIRSMQMEMELDKIEKNVQQVLYYTRLDTFSKDYLIEEFSLKQVVEKSLKHLATYFILKKLKVTFKGSDFKVISDEKWLMYTIEQVLSNASKYTPEKGEITISFESTKDQNILRIEDNGYGIPLEDLPRIFDKGFTGSRGRKDEKSTGLGLYLAKNLMEKLGHQLKVSSTLDEGTTVSFIFGRENTFFL